MRWNVLKRLFFDKHYYIDTSIAEKHAYYVTDIYVYAPVRDTVQVIANYYTRCRVKRVGVCRKIFDYLRKLL